MREAPENLKPLTSLRYAAAMWVVGYHYWPDLTRAAMPNLVAKGYLGVELFFVLSGFILSHVYLHAFGQRRFSYGSFLWARLARIYPLHLATLVGLAAMVGAAAMLGVQTDNQVMVWSSLPAQLTLTQAWGLALHGGWNHPSWSISAEWFAYLSFPAFAWAAWRLRRRPWLAIALALAGMVALDTGFQRVAGFPLTTATIAWGALRIVPCFAYGCALYLLWRVSSAGRRSAAVAIFGAFFIATVGSVAAAAPDALTVALFGGLILSLAALSRAGSGILSSRVGVYLGELSFAVYMVCIPWELAFSKLAERLMHLAEGPLPWPLWLLMLVGATPLAMAVHHLIERPARSAMRGWKASGSARAARNLEAQCAAAEVVLS